MDEQRRLEGFKALVASDKSNGFELEDADGEYRYWKDLSAEGKLRQLADNAAYYGVPFEPFAREVRDTLGHLPAAAREEAALRLVLRNEEELHQLAKLLPEHDRTEPYPLIKQLRDTLDDYRQTVAELSGDAKIGKAVKESFAEAARQQDGLAKQFQQMLGDASAARAGLLAHDTAEGVKTQLEAFMDEFERLARTREQKELVEGFKDFVREVTSAGMVETFDKLLRRAGAAKPEPTALAEQFQELVSQPRASSRPGADKGLESVKNRDTEQHKDRGIER